MGTTFRYGVFVIAAVAGCVLLRLAAMGVHPLVVVPTGHSAAPCFEGPEEIWSPPVPNWLAHHFPTVPAWTKALGQVVVLLILLKRHFRHQPFTITVLTTALLADGSGTAIEQGIFLAAAATLLLHEQETPASPDWKRWGLFAGCLLLGVLTSIEAGLMLLLALAVLFTRSGGSCVRRLGALLGTVVLSAVGYFVVAWIKQPLAATLLRPVLWLFTPSLSLAYPATAAVWSVNFSLSQALYLLVVAIAWRRVLRSQGNGQVGTLCLVTVLGLCCSYYLPAAATVAAFLLPGIPTGVNILTERIGRLRMAAALFIFAAVAGHEVFWDSQLLPSAQSERAQLTPESWQASGNVLLMDLGDAPFWRRPGLDKFRLIADDRWEYASVHYAHYVAVWQDLVTFRPESYLRTDGAEGGYARQLREWQPTLLVVPTGSHAAVRQLSLNPQCRLIAMDGKRAVFAWAEQRDLAEVIARASKQWQALEWAGPMSTGGQQTVHTGSRADRLQAAEALCAARLPVACLRLLDDRQLPWTDRLRGLAYLEIAHREGRHSDQASALYLARGARLLERSMAWPLWSPAQRLRAATALSAVSLTSQASAVAEPLSKVPGRWRCSSEQFDTALALQAAAADVPQASAGSTTLRSATPAESQWRLTLISGDVTAARHALEAIDATVRPYYQWLTAAVDQPPRQAAQSLLELLLARPRWPSELLGRAWYDLGSLGLEVGDHQLAVQAFRRSQALAPQAGYAEMRALHLRMLAGVASAPP